jgi:molecular chaperone DnaK
LHRQDELVGQAARRRRPIDPLNTIFSSKRLIGRTWHSAATREFRRRYPFELLEADDGTTLISTRAGKKSPTDVAAAILTAARERSGIDFNGRTAVIAVPSVFRDAQRDATVAAGKRAGLSDVKLIDEATATAMAYLGGKPEPLRYAAIYDFGGGTFDLAVVDCQTQPFTVLAHGGDLYLGGDDLDHALAEWLAARVLERDRWDLRSNAATFGALVAAAEEAKIRLCSATSATVDVRAIDAAAPASVGPVEVPQSAVADLAMRLMKRSFIICDEVLMQAKKKARDMDAVFLAGGVTHVPVIRDGVAAYFGKPPRTDVDPMHAVAIGASLYTPPG